MAFKTSKPISFTSFYLEKRKTKRVFLKQINQLIDWRSVENTIEKYYTTGQATRGRKAYPSIVLFKMILLQTCYNLSDYGVEEQTNDSLSFMCFCALQLEDRVPDHSVIARFRKALNQAGVWEVLLDKINAQLTRHGVLVKQGAIVDASLTPTPRKPKGKTSYELTPEQGVEKVSSPGVDQEARWVKKGSSLQYGYKRHYLSDAKAGLVLSVHTRAANAHDSLHLRSCLDQVQLPPGSRVLADKGYC